MTSARRISPGYRLRGMDFEFCFADRRHTDILLITRTLCEYFAKESKEDCDTFQQAMLKSPAYYVYATHNTDIVSVVAFTIAHKTIFIEYCFTKVGHVKHNLMSTLMRMLICYAYQMNLTYVACFAITQASRKAMTTLGLLSNSVTSLDMAKFSSLPEDAKQQLCDEIDIPLERRSVLFYNKIRNAYRNRSIPDILASTSFESNWMRPDPLPQVQYNMIATLESLQSLSIHTLTSTCPTLVDNMLGIYRMMNFMR